VLPVEIDCRKSVGGEPDTKYTSSPFTPKTRVATLPEPLSVMGADTTPVVESA
jgi:hypothetical protein